MHKTADLLMGSSENNGLEQRIFNAVTFAATVINIAILLRYLPDLSPDRGMHFLGLSLVATSSQFALYFLNRRRIVSAPPIWPYFICNYLFLYFEWFYVGGPIGITQRVFLAIVAITPLLVSKRQLLPSFALHGSFLTLLGWLTLNGDYFQVAVPLSMTALRNIFFETGFVAIGIGASTTLAMYSYRQAKKQLQQLNQQLLSKNAELETALSEVKTLRRIIPICAWCKKIRNEEGLYEEIETYVRTSAGVDFSHTICSDCKATVT